MDVWQDVDRCFALKAGRKRPLKSCPRRFNGVRRDCMRTGFDHWLKGSGAHLQGEVKWNKGQPVMFMD